jgi:hypothetical protein
VDACANAVPTTLAGGAGTEEELADELAGRAKA